MRDIFDSVKPTLISLDSLVVLTEVQPRTQMRKETLALYIEEMKRGEKFPALCVFRDPETSERILASGFTRAAAHEAVGTSRVHAKILPGDRNDARLYAAGTNASHGLPRSQADKRRVVDRVIKMKPRFANRAIARLCRVTHPFVAKRRALMADSQGGNVTTQGDGSIRGSEWESAGFDVDFECGNLRQVTLEIAGRCNPKELKTLIRTLHELQAKMTKRSKRTRKGTR